MNFGDSGLSNNGHLWGGQQACARTQVLANTLTHTYTHTHTLTVQAVLSELYSGEDDAYRDRLHSQMIQQWNCSVSYDPSLGTFSVSDYPGSKLHKPLKQQVILVQRAFLPCALNVAFYQPISSWHGMCGASRLSARSAHGGRGSFITQDFGHEIQNIGTKC